MTNNNSLLETPVLFEKPLHEEQPATNENAQSKETAEDMNRIWASLRRRFLNTYHHHPERLWVAVNGISVASLDVCNNENSLTITTKVAEPLDFIEVFSEQQIRLAMLNINTSPENPVDNNANISLSDARKLRVSFSEQDAGLSIRVVYADPEIQGWERLVSLGLIEWPDVEQRSAMVI